MKKLLLLVVLIFTTMTFAQKLKVVSGNFDFLKDQTEVNIELKFDNVLITSDRITESQYLEDRKKDVLANPKRGKAGWEKWSGEWERYKSEVYLADVLKSLSRTKNLVFNKGLNSKYTLLIDAKWIHPGWHGGLIMQPAILSADIRFVETSKPSVTLLEMSATEVAGKMPSGMSGDVMEYDRISSAYERLGRLLSREISKGIK